MTEQEEHFVHFTSCRTWLYNAWRVLPVIEAQEQNSLGPPAFRFAFIEYCKPYKMSRGINRDFKLDAARIPNALLPLDERSIKSRDQVHAHSDLTIMEARLHEYESMGQPSTFIVKNVITGVEELPHIEEIIGIIEVTLDKMEIEFKDLKAALSP